MSGLRGGRRRDAITQPATVRDVARQAGVSTATVSRVLAGGDAVSEGLAKRVFAAAKELDYRPNRVARSLRVRRTRTIGVLIPNIQNPFFTGVVRGIEDVLRATDYTLLLGNSDDDAEREEKYLETFRAEGVSGLVLVPGPGRTRTYDEILDAGVPVVAIDQLLPKLEADSVTVANSEGAAVAVRHLIAAGHQRIAAITGPEDLSTAVDRLNGYFTAMRESGLPIDDALVHHAPFRPEGGYQATLALLALPRPPRAIFAASDLTALGVLRALHERRIRIPDEIAIVSFDDMPWAAALQPALTAIAQPMYEMGTTAARLLLERLRTPNRPLQKVRLQTQLVVRASCGASPALRAQIDAELEEKPTLGTAIKH